MMPKISVIVPVYNVEQYLHHCIDSILAQSFTDFELLLINDGSKDSSGRICDEYLVKDNRVRVFHKENGGVSSARNMGLDNARGEYISFLDSDDWVESSMLSEIFKSAKINNADMVFIDIRYHYPTELKDYKSYRWKGNPKEDLVDYLKQTRCVPGWALIKSKLIKNNHFRFSENLTIYEDFHMMVKLVYQSNIISQVEKPLYNYRMQDNSIVHSMNPQKVIENQIWAYNSVLDYFKDNGVYGVYAPSLYGRILHDYQRMVLDSSLHNEFRKIYPEKKHFIWKCTTINFKLKILMWCLTHHMSYIALIYCVIRKFYKQFKQ